MTPVQMNMVGGTVVQLMSMAATLRIFAAHPGNSDDLNEALKMIAGTLSDEAATLDRVMNDQ